MLNHITIMGRLTREPELRTTQSGVSVASFTVAVDRDFAQNGERQTDFIDCVAWRQTGEFVSKYFRKGSMIVVDGRLQSRRWEDRDGNKRTSWEILTDRAYFGEGKRDGRQDEDSGPREHGDAYDSDLHVAGKPVNVDAGDFEELGDDDGELPF